MLTMTIYCHNAKEIPSGKLRYNCVNIRKAPINRSFSYARTIYLAGATLRLRLIRLSDLEDVISS